MQHLGQNQQHFTFQLDTALQNPKIYKTAPWTDLGGDEGKISCCSAGGSATLTPIDESEGIGGVTGDAEGVDEGGGENGLLEAIGAALTIEVGENEANGGEEVAVNAEGVEELTELGALLRRRLAPLRPREEAAQHAEFGLLRRHLNFEEAKE